MAASGQHLNLLPGNILADTVNQNLDSNQKQIWPQLHIYFKNI